MKKVLALAGVLALSFSMTVFADPLAEFDTDQGHMVVQRYEVDTEEDGTYLYLIYDWTNNGDEPSDASMECMWEAYQNGKEIEHDTSIYYRPDTDGYGGTKVMTGYTTTGHMGFKLPDNTPVEIHASLFFGDEVANFTIDPSAEAPAMDVSEDEPVSDEPAAPTVGDKIVELEQRIADLEQRVADLEG